MDIFAEILTGLQSEERIILATVVSTTGSTPAAALSKMIVKQGGTVSVGTVGGGCMEGDVLLHANRLYQSGKAEILTFRLDEDDAEAGLICGGSLDVFIEPIAREQISLFQELKSLRDDGEDCVLATLLASDGKIESKQIVLLSPHAARPLASNIPHLTSDVDQLVAKAHKRQETQRIELPYGELILEPVFGCPSLIVFGGGHVAKYVSQMATLAGFRVTVVDDREKYANPQRFPEASRTLVTDFAEAFGRLTVKPSSYIVIVTRGHKHDEIVLEQALKTPVKYIGMIGSRRKVLTTYERLMERGVTREQLQRLHAPVGIDIGAVTAEEIAVSIVAELVHVRRNPNQPLRHKSEKVREFIVHTLGKEEDPLLQPGS